MMTDRSAGPIVWTRARREWATRPGFVDLVLVCGWTKIEQHLVTSLEVVADLFGRDSLGLGGIQLCQLGAQLIDGQRGIQLAKELARLDGHRHFHRDKPAFDVLNAELARPQVVVFAYGPIPPALDLDAVSPGLSLSRRQLGEEHGDFSPESPHRWLLAGLWRDLGSEKIHDAIARAGHVNEVAALIGAAGCWSRPRALRR